MRDSEIKNILGGAIRTARLRANISQEELGDRSGLDRTYIGGVERGERNPSLVSLYKIAEGLNLTLSELFEGIPMTKRVGR